MFPCQQTTHLSNDGGLRQFLRIETVTNVTNIQTHFLTGAKRREWMGCWGLLGLLIVSQWIIPFPTFSTSKKTCEKNKHVLGHSNTQEDAKKSDSKSVINFVSIFWG